MVVINHARILECLIIVLPRMDDSHVIKNRKAKQTEACMALEADRRWVLTGKICF